MKAKLKSERKAIFVRPEVFELFRKEAIKDGRVYSEFLRKLLEK